MTNEQTVVWLNNYRNQLIDAKQKIELLLPEELKTKYKDFLGRPYLGYEQLSSLDDIICKLKDDIENLGGKAA